MIVIDWQPNGQGGFFANVLLDETNGERWIWNGTDDCYDELLDPNDARRLDPDFKQISLGQE